VKFVGLDLAGSPKRPTGFCIIDLKRYTHCKILYSDSEIVAAVRKSKARFVAIDAPLALPKGRHCLGEHCRGRAHFRACDVAQTNENQVLSNNNRSDEDVDDAWNSPEAETWTTRDRSRRNLPGCRTRSPLDSSEAT
jgi:hypothetical protein